MPKIKNTALTRTKRKFLKDLFDIHNCISVPHYQETSGGFKDVIEHINLGRYVTAHISSTQCLIFNQPNDIREKIITTKIEYLTNYVKEIFYHNYSDEKQSEEEFWNFISEGFREVIETQFDPKNLINFYKTKVISAAYINQQSPSIFAAKIARNMAEDFQKIFNPIEAKSAIRNAAVFIKLIKQEATREYYIKTQRVWSPIGVFLNILIALTALFFGYPAALLALAIGITANYFFAEKYRDLTDATKNHQIQLANKISNIDAILESYLGKRIIPEFRYSVYLQRFGDPTYRFKATQIEYEPEFSKNHIKTENQKPEYVEFIFSQVKSTDYKKIKPIKLKDHEKEPKDIQSKPLIKWFLQESNEEHPRALITGANKNNPNSMICITFPDHPKRDSQLLDKIQKREFGFAGKRRETGFKYYSNKNQYTFKYNNVRWDCQPTQQKILIKNNRGETKSVPEYQCITYRQK